MISAFSVLNALLVYTIMLFGVCKLSTRHDFIEKGGGSVLWSACIFTVARLVLPVEIPWTHAIRLWNLLGIPQRFLYAFPFIAFAVLAVWGIGMLKYMWRDVRKLHAAYKKCDDYVTMEDEHVREIADRCKVKCRVLLSPNVETPYVVGILRHKIYLPYPPLSDQDTEMALRHEAQHIRGCDALIRLLFGLLSEAVWWSRLSESFQAVVDKSLELRCDRKVMKRMTEAERTAYLEMLTNVADRIVSEREALALGMNEFRVVGHGESSITQRFKVIEAARKGEQKWYIRYGAEFLVVAVFCASYLVMFQGAGAPSKEIFQNDSENYYYENYDGPDIGDESRSAFIIKGPDGRYQLYVDYVFNRYLAEDEVNSDKYQYLHVFEEVRQR